MNRDYPYGYLKATNYQEVLLFYQELHNVFAYNYEDTKSNEHSVFKILAYILWSSNVVSFTLSQWTVLYIKAVIWAGGKTVCQKGTVEDETFHYIS